MIIGPKKSVLGVLVDVVDYEAVVQRVIDAARAREPLGVAALAVHGVMSGVLDRTQRHRLNHLDLVVPDGQPVRWALNLLHGADLAERVYGPELTLRICQRAAVEGLPVFLYGSSARVLRPLRTNLEARFGLKVAGARPSAFRKLTAAEQQDVVDEIHGSGAALTLVGLGCPRQEVWVYEQRDRLQMLLLAVGAAFDFHAGLLAQAPPVMQRRGLEWLFRLTREPSRLWQRYLLLNPLYMFLLALQAAGLVVQKPHQDQPPRGDIRYG